MKAKLDKRDIALAIRDFLDDKTIVHHREDRAGDLHETGVTADVVTIDVSEPDNIVIELDSDQVFHCRILQIA